MGRMPVEHIKYVGGYTIILGPCPGCFCWQLEYENATFSDVQDLHENIEWFLQDHLNECPGLQEIVRSML